jgi:cytochrome c oxidase assembly protein subunit 15
MTKKNWLLSLVVLLLLMISVGGLTRLTRSGLSMVEWRPVTGILPPLSDSAWEHEFDLYKKSPEFQQVNTNFGIEDYKQIFFLEYVHRVLGRLIFLFVVFPGLWLWRKRLVSGKLVAGLAGLVAAQGLVGWLMVRSGLQNEPHVSPWMLTLHFFSALTVLLTAFFNLVKLRAPLEFPKGKPELFKQTRTILILLAGVLVMQLIYGCLTAGMKAGFAFNTFPMMGGDFFPAGGLLQEPSWMNWLQNPATVQWTHRWMGISFFIGVLGFLGLMIRNKEELPAAKGPAFHLMGVTLVQVILGIMNILLTVPTLLAVTHQLIAVLVLMALANLYWRIRIQN